MRDADVARYLGKSPTVLKVIEAALAKLGHRITAGTGAAAGLTLARELETAPALVLLDAAMSDKDGVACCQELASIPRLGGVPIVLMVPKGGDPEERLARAPQVVDYITKPFSPDAIGALVERLLGSAGRRRAGSDAPTLAVQQVALDRRRIEFHDSGRLCGGRSG